MVHAARVAEEVMRGQDKRCRVAMLGRECGYNEGIGAVAGELAEWLKAAVC